MPAVVVLTVGFGVFSLVCSLAGAGENRLHLIAQTWARVVLKVCFVRVEVEGIEKLDPARNYVIVSNHASYMDTPVIVACMPLQFRFFAKLGLFQIPLLGTHMTRSGYFPVHRGNVRASLKSMAEAAKAIAARNISVLLFPEGGRSESGLGEFKEGASYIAIKSGVPMAPIGLVGTREALPMHSLRVRPGLVRLRVGDPIETSGMSLADRNRLSEMGREQVAKLIGFGS